MNKLKDEYKSEPVLAGVALILIAAVVLTRSVAMSAMVHMMLLGLFLVAVFGYAAFIYKEQPADEREQELSMVASKYAYLVGAAVLSLGTVLQSLDHDLDIWLPITLGSMVIAKSLGYFFHNN